MFVKALIGASLLGALALVSSPSLAQTSSGSMFNSGPYQTGFSLPSGAGVEQDRKCDLSNNAQTFATCNVIQSNAQCRDAEAVIIIGPFVVTLRRCRSVG